MLAACSRTAGAKRSTSSSIRRPPGRFLMNQRAERSSSRRNSRNRRHCTSVLTRLSSASTSPAYSVSPNTERLTMKARATCSTVAPVSSVARCM